MSRSNSPSARSGRASQSGLRRWGRAQQDRRLDPYEQAAKPRGPTVCSQCGAVFHHGRWQWTMRPANAQEMLCQACRRINDQYPAGIITLSGPFVTRHKDEMIRPARNQEQAERPEHPLNRIMDIEEAAPDRLVISTTDIHLPRRIGEAVTRAYHGTMAENFAEGEYFIRVDWSRSE